MGKLCESLKKYTKAFQWYQKSAQRGLADAEYALGVLYYKGQGTTQNKVLARQWLKKAAKNGNEQALQKLKEWKL